MLVCTSCSSALAITLNSKLSANSSEKLCSIYRERIVSYHDTKCPFRLSTEQFHYLQAVEETDNYADERGRGNIDATKNENNSKAFYQKSRLIIPVFMARFLPEESIRLMEHPTPSSIIRQHAKKLSDVLLSFSVSLSSSSLSWRYPKLKIPSKFQRSQKLTKFLGYDESIITLSLLGWQKVNVNKSDRVVTMGCPLCFSLMGLQLDRELGGNNKNVVVAEDDSDVNESGRSPKRRKYRDLNPLDAHRHYCPYKVGFPRIDTERNPIWKIILDRVDEESQCGQKLHSGAGTVEETSSNVVADDVLNESINNVRRILRTGIASKT
mmetsp:Transcript_2646/g.2905  ORF Transcript_2646/g.2905 Transcript_2646/m.2905 type:complete len:324 (-) Transcript_2646:279-1250(-)